MRSTAQKCIATMAPAPNFWKRLCTDGKFLQGIAWRRKARTDSQPFNPPREFMEDKSIFCHLKRLHYRSQCDILFAGVVGSRRPQIETEMPHLCG